MQGPQPSSIATLLGDAFQRLMNLLRGEIVLARAEFGQSVSRAGTGIALVLGATVFAITGLNLAAGALVAALVAAGQSPAVATVIVAAAFGLLAVLMVLAGVKSLKSVVRGPLNVAKNIREDANTFKEILPNGTEH